MTRLTEALERARAGAGTPQQPADVGQDSRDVPADWQFKEADHAPAPAEEAVARIEAVAPGHWPPVPAPPISPSGGAAMAPASLPPDSLQQDSAKLVSGPQDNLLIEQFRRLAAVLHHAQVQRHAHTVMIASAVPAEGKSLTASNLALTLSRSYEKRVLLVDTDLRRPSLHTLFNVSNSAGLTTTLNDPQQGRLPVVQVDQNLWLLPAGRPDPNPTSLVTSPAMKQLLEEASTQFDWVILDTPPVGLMPDANLLAAMVDAAFVVVNAGETPYPLVKKAVDAIGLERVLGVVLNRADRSAAAAAYSYDYYDYYASGAPNEPAGKRFALG